MKRKAAIGVFLIAVGIGLIIVGINRNHTKPDVTADTNAQVAQTAEATEQPTPEATPEATPEPTPEPSPSAEPVKTFEGGLKELYQDDFYIGVALPNHILNNMGVLVKTRINDNFSSITCENEMKPDAILDKNACQKGLPETYTNPAVKFDSSQRIVNYALENGMKMRLHTLVWHSQTPDWFFTEDYTPEGKLVSREVMLQRMENYEKNVIEYFNTTYPGLIYAVDVCNEAFDRGDGDANQVRKKNNKWYETVGDDYYYQAFVFARRYAPDDWSLFYNDYGCVNKTDIILNHLQKAKDEGLIDGIGMQSHLDINDDISNKFKFAVKKFCDAGYEVQITELDIGMDEVNEANLNRQGRKYKAMFSMLKDLRERGYNITSVTVWGLNDKFTWRAGKAPLLFDSMNAIKPAYEGAMLSEDIKAIE